MKLSELAKVAMMQGAPHIKYGEQMRCTKELWKSIALAVAKAVLAEAANRADQFSGVVGDDIRSLAAELERESDAR